MEMVRIQLENDKEYEYSDLVQEPGKYLLGFKEDGLMIIQIA